jgi:hypothetical protein
VVEDVCHGTPSFLSIFATQQRVVGPPGSGANGSQPRRAARNPATMNRSRGVRIASN